MNGLGNKFWEYVVHCNNERLRIGGTKDNKNDNPRQDTPLFPMLPTSTTPEKKVVIAVDDSDSESDNEPIITGLSKRDKRSDVTR